MKKAAIIITIASMFFSSCERDDICAEGTPITPLLVIEFFDSDNPSEEKVPTDLFLVEEGSEVGLSFNTATIAIPLRTDIDQTRYNFVLNFGSEDQEAPQNADLLVFDYLREEDFVSKACGFRVTYQAIQDQFFPLQDNAWIENVTILNSTVEDDTEAHIRIFH